MAGLFVALRSRPYLFNPYIADTDLAGAFDLKADQAAFATFPALMQLVQTFIRRALPWGVFTRMDCRFGLKTRGVRLLACETLLPNCGPLPQTSQRFAMITKSPVGSRDHTVRIGMSN